MISTIRGFNYNNPNNSSHFDPHGTSIIHDINIAVDTCSYKYSTHICALHQHSH